MKAVSIQETAFFLRKRVLKITDYLVFVIILADDLKTTKIISHTSKYSSTLTT